MKFFLSHSYRENAKKTKGFTLVEFVVIMGIFAIMVGVIMSNFNGFKSLITLDNLAQDIALSIRQVQTSAGSSLSDNNPDQSYWRGILFTPDISNGGYQPSFTIYQSGDINGVYREGDEILDVIKIQTTDRITGFTSYNSDGSFVNRQTLATNEPVSIAFRRFSTNAIVSPDNGQTVTCIEISAPDAGNDATKKRSVCVTQLGQISVR